MAEDPAPRLRAVHRALADPLRIRLYELLVGEPQSAKELAARVSLPPDRLYHHLAQLEEAKLIEVADYRRLPGGKAERVYAPTPDEPPGDDASPADLAALFGAAIEITRADVNAAARAQEDGEDRKVGLHRTVVRLNERHLNDLRAKVDQLIAEASASPDDDGVYTTVLWVSADRQDRRAASRPHGPGEEEKG